MPSAEIHFVNRAGWLRAAALEANDGIIFDRQPHRRRRRRLTRRDTDGGSGRLGGGRSGDGGGEYVSVGSQANSEAADLKREQRAL